MNDTMRERELPEVLPAQGSEGSIVGAMQATEEGVINDQRRQSAEAGTQRQCKQQGETKQHRITSCMCVNLISGCTY